MILYICALKKLIQNLFNLKNTKTMKFIMICDYLYDTVV